MARDVLEATFRKILPSGLMRDQLTVVWHAGEPLVLPPEWYDAAFETSRRACPPGLLIKQTFQSNGTLINDAWVKFFARSGAGLSLSIDGPAWLHDHNRVSRSKRGTHGRCMLALQKLQDSGIFPAVLTVLTAASLGAADELFDFYRDSGISDVAFNVEEAEAAHTESSMARSGTEHEYRAFLNRFLLRMQAEPGTLQLRELSNALGVIRNGGVPRGANQEAEPMRILSVASDGSVSTFSPEFLGTFHPEYGDFVFGNIASDSLSTISERVLSSQLYYDIEAGRSECSRTCAWYGFCGGGTPGNKIFENGNARTTETQFCRLTRQAALDAVLTSIESRG